MNSITRKITLSAAALIAVGTLTACSTGSDASGPLDRSGTSNSASTDSIEQAAIQMAWDSVSYSDQATMCDFYLDYPQAAYAAFNEGAEGAFSQSDFIAFFDAHC